MHLIPRSTGLQSCCLSDPFSLSCFACLQRRETFMSLSPGIRVSCSGKSNKAPSTYRLLRVDGGVKPSSCSVFKPLKAHISCINHLHIQLLSSLLQHRHMWITLFLTHIIDIRFTFLNSICYLDNTFIKCVTNNNTGMDLFMQGVA